MRAGETRLLDVLGQPDAQFVVPAFQRVYSWTARECEQLAEDVMAAGAADRPHFAGTFLYSTVGEEVAEVETADRAEAVVRILQVIDGQQRATTVTLMLGAFAGHLREKGEIARADDIVRRYLVNATADQPKLLLTSIDGDMLAFLLGVHERPQDVASRLEENRDLFAALMARPTFDDEMFWRGCELLQVIAIELDEHDAPQEVFESLNSKGKRLAVEDLVRSTILRAATEDGADGARSLYETAWLPLEDKVASAPGVSMEDVLCSWIASRHADVYLNAKSEVFPLFKTDLARRYNGDCARLLTDISVYADKFTGNEAWRRERLSELDRWLQGKPRNIISERKMFGD